MLAGMRKFPRCPTCMACMMTSLDFSAITVSINCRGGLHTDKLVRGKIYTLHLTEMMKVANPMRTFANRSTAYCQLFGSHANYAMLLRSLPYYYGLTRRPWAGVWVAVARGLHTSMRTGMLDTCAHTHKVLAHLLWPRLQAAVWVWVAVA